MTASLHILTLKCVNKEEPLANDRINIYLNGAFHSGPHVFRKGDEVTLNSERDFNGAVVIALKEQDNGANLDDSLGNHRVEEIEIGVGKQDAVFHALARSDYHMEYQVEKAPEA